MSLTRKDLDELKPWVESTVEKVLGFSEPSIAHAALNCVEKGFDKRKTRVKLQDFLDEKSATKFCERFFLELDLQRAALSSRVKHPKRNRADEDEITDMIKKTRYEVASNGVGLPASNNNPAKPLPAATLAALNAAAAKVDQIPDINQLMPGEDESATPLSTDQIKAMMENAKRMIAQKKAELGPPPPPQALMTRMLPPPAVIASVRPEPEDPDLPIPGPRSRVLNSEEQDKLKRAAELQAQIKSKLLGMTMVPDLMSVEVRARAAAAAKAAEAPKPKTQAPKLIVDSEGRTIDAQGNEVTLAPRAPELKANLRAVKREEFKKGTQSVMPKEVEVNKYLDYRIEAKAADRTKRSFKFHDAGKFQQMASRLRTKAQLEKLQNQISLAAKKTGISSAARLAGLVPKKDASEGAEIPQVEWWDYYILEDACYDYLEEKGADAINDQVLTNLIEHPLQMDPPANANKPIHLPIMLTKRERKKLRRQTRNEALKEKTEKVRLGLEAPPEPKMRISNLMRVLGTEAVADPTKMEAHVRAQMAKRQRVHEEANAARKLTKEQRTEKKKKKIGEVDFTIRLMMEGLCTYDSGHAKSSSLWVAIPSRLIGLLGVGHQ
jgi:U4/U6 small nuclear ribonucleoprotein PRP3